LNHDVRLIESASAELHGPRANFARLEKRLEGGFRDFCLDGPDSAFVGLGGKKNA
jgi:hypothetical protein